MIWYAPTWVVLQMCTPALPFLARTTLSLAERNMYLQIPLYHCQTRYSFKPGTVCLLQFLFICTLITSSIGKTWQKGRIYVCKYYFRLYMGFQPCLVLLLLFYICPLFCFRNTLWLNKDIIISVELIQVKSDCSCSGHTNQSNQRLSRR